MRRDYADAHYAFDVHAAEYFGLRRRYVAIIYYAKRSARY